MAQEVGSSHRSSQHSWTCMIRGLTVAAHQDLSRCIARRHFARRLFRPQPVPAVLKFGEETPTAKPTETRVVPADGHVQRRHRPRHEGKPISGDLDIPVRPRPGGVRPRLRALKAVEIDPNFAPYEDPNTPPPGTPIEDRPLPNWKVMRTQNGNLPVYSVYTRQGTEVTTYVKHFYGEVEVFRRELMNICESPVRVRAGAFQIRGLHTWKVQEYLMSMGM
uniref:Large ribosomal subunit protein mL49 n=1 Tax=Noctiluca scintillans TaxID=2966 RepID=A0A7S0ZPD5_NOCSC